MKLGTETNSLVNYMYSRTKSQEPVVGLPATVLAWTDRYGGSITKVWKMRSKQFILIDTPSGLFNFRKDGEKWRHVHLEPMTNRWHLSTSYGLILGVADDYRDPSF